MARDRISDGLSRGVIATAGAFPLTAFPTCGASPVPALPYDSSRAKGGIAGGAGTAGPDLRRGRFRHGGLSGSSAAAPVDAKKPSQRPAKGTPGESPASFRIRLDRLPSAAIGAGLGMARSGVIRRICLLREMIESRKGARPPADKAAGK